MKVTRLFLGAALIGTLGFLQMSCEDSSNDMGPDGGSGSGTLKVSITDSPIDSPEVKGAFVTVTEIKVDGKTFDGFKGPKTVNLLELQNGNSLELGSGNFNAGTFSKITLVLDYEKDASGTAPGCYIQKADNTKQKLQLNGSTQNAIELTAKQFAVQEGKATELVMDFDLRKAIKSETSGSQTTYSFVSYGELQAAIRTVDKPSSSDISGKIDNYNSTTMGDVVVYVYKKGTFNQSTETQGQGESQIKFKNAVTSAKVDGSGNFKAAFLEQGDYEVHCASYSKPTGGFFGLKALLNIQSKNNVDLSSIVLKSDADVSLSISVSTILGL
ncbi:DUF4382 domain-containing protein [Emticicia sp. 21SJ11W-3]|uniref:DUF4382 domain-containing protein n=1 Tax=Emticicia sp. 21SJ11W-3 TaxID=2916755 RepID=UPI0020A22122|nr:DUF4382 domain-containing protein [Emticicia sp. 21SJ11W-3]UTA69624.1 DUF4382 domain-containing protein [Emticicia sp. 21SJ11W-3]